MEENITKKDFQELKTDIQNVLEAVNTFASHTDNRFERIENDIGGLKTEVGSLKTEVCAIKASMVTKAYLDDKLADLKGDMVAMVRKEDVKVDNLTGLLSKKSVLSKIEAKEIQLMGPFPKVL
jgi:hypothetical protein